jgi:hypothetical protein
MMKRKLLMKNFILSMVFGILVTLGLSPYAQGRDWVCFDPQKDVKECTTFYDKNDIKDLSDDLLGVWVKALVTKEEKKDYLEKRIKEGKSNKGYDKLAYALFEFDINCQDKLYRVLSQGDYDENDVRLEAYLTPFAGWQKKDSYTEPLFGRLCRSK